MKLRVHRGHSTVNPSGYTFEITVDDDADPNSFKLGQSYEFWEVARRGVDNKAWYGTVDWIEEKQDDGTWKRTDAYDVVAWSSGHGGRGGDNTFTVKIHPSSLQF